MVAASCATTVSRRRSQAPAAARWTAATEVLRRVGDNLLEFTHDRSNDQQLLDLAAAGRLRNPAVLDQQVKRMLADPRSKAFTDNFFGQWLYLRNVKLHNFAPDQAKFWRVDSRPNR